MAFTFVAEKKIAKKIYNFFSGKPKLQNKKIRNEQNFKKKKFAKYCEKNLRRNIFVKRKIFAKENSMIKIFTKKKKFVEKNFRKKNLSKEKFEKLFKNNFSKFFKYLKKKFG